MSLDQASRLRQLVCSSDARRGGSTSALPMVVVGGGKGGVGTSTIAMQLAIALSRLGQRSVLVEADLDRGGNVKQECDGGSIADCLTGRLTARDALEPGPDRVWVLPGAWAPPDLTVCTATAQERLIDELRSLGTHADVLIVDVGSSRNSFVRRFWRAASMVVMVTTTEANSVMDSYAAIKVLLAGDTSIPVYTLVNFAADGPNAFVVHERVRATCKRFLGLRTALLGHVATTITESAFHALAERLCEELGLSGLSRTAPPTARIS